MSVAVDSPLSYECGCRPALSNAGTVLPLTRLNGAERRVSGWGVYRGTSLIRNRPTLGPYSRPMPVALWLP